MPAHQADILGRMGIRIAELFVHSIYNGYRFWGPPSFYDLWHDLREASKRSALTGI